MAWANASLGGTVHNTSKSSSSSLGSGTAPTTPVAGDFLVVAVAKDNAASADAQTSEVTSVTDTAGGNTYLKAGEFCNAQGGANSGATVSLWYCVLSTSWDGATALTANLSDARTAKALQVHRFTKAAGTTISVEGLQTLANDGADPGSMSIAGLASQEYLFVRASAIEAEPPASSTFTSGYAGENVAGGTGTTGGGGASNMTTFLEWDIATGTGSTSDPTVVSADCASVMVAFKETAAATPAGVLQQPVQPFLHNLLR